MEKYYISTAIAYASGKPHIGNTYEIVLADAIARNKRLEGYDVYLQTGTDEHGEKIQNKAKDKGITPRFVTETYYLRLYNGGFVRDEDGYTVSPKEACFKGNKMTFTPKSMSKFSQ